MYVPIREQVSFKAEENSEMTLTAHNPHWKNWLLVMTANLKINESNI